MFSKVSRVGGLVQLINVESWSEQQERHLERLFPGARVVPLKETVGERLSSPSLGFPAIEWDLHHMIHSTGPTAIEPTHATMSKNKQIHFPPFKLIDLCYITTSASWLTHLVRLPRASQLPPGPNSLQLRISSIRIYQVWVDKIPKRVMHKSHTKQYEFMEIFFLFCCQAQWNT